MHSYHIAEQQTRCSQLQLPGRFPAAERTEAERAAHVGASAPGGTDTARVEGRTTCEARVLADDGSRGHSPRVPGTRRRLEPKPSRPAQSEGLFDVGGGGQGVEVLKDEGLLGRVPLHAQHSLD